MAAERGQRTRIRFGGVSAEVALLKTSGKPQEAQHETRRVLVEDGPLNIERGQEVAADPLGGLVQHGPNSLDDLASDPRLSPPDDVTYAALGTPPPPDGPDDHRTPAQRAQDARDAETDIPAAEAGWSGAPDDPGDPFSFEQAMTDAAAPAYTPPPTRIEQGVYLEDGTWVDLTDRLAEIDARTKVDGMEVVATIASSSVPRERVRDAHYVAGVEPSTYKVLSLLWQGLRLAGAAAVVRWTKRTQQALGILVARGDLGPGRGAHLLLLECEWSQNMRKPGPRVLGPVRAETSDDEAHAAHGLVLAFYARPAVVDDLRDERLAKRAELLALAREGKLDGYEPPLAPTPEPAAPGVAEALTAAAAEVRERAGAR